MRNNKISNIVEESRNHFKKVLSPKEHIDKIIDNTFRVLSNINMGDNSESHLIFPNYRDAKTRYSEQELRFVVVEQFILYCSRPENEECRDWYYSVETPTEGDYGFSGKGKRSAEIDLTIHSKDKNRLALIEFKANMHVPAHFDKDFEKLAEEPGNSLRYFVMYFPSSDAGTISKIKQKIGNKNSKTIFVCYDIKKADYLIDER